jgi:hypothetical protein
VAERKLHVATQPAGGLDQFERAAFLDRKLKRKSFAMVVGKSLKRETDLPELAETINLLRTPLGLAQHRQEQRGEDGHDKHHEHQFQ